MAVSQIMAAAMPTALMMAVALAPARSATTPPKKLPAMLVKPIMLITVAPCSAEKPMSVACAAMWVASIITQTPIRKFRVVMNQKFLFLKIEMVEKTAGGGASGRSAATGD